MSKQGIMRTFGLGFMVLATLSAATTGCGSSGEEAGVQSTAPVVESVKPSEPPATLKVILYEGSAAVNYDNFITHYIEEKTNTKLVITPIPGAQLEEKLNVMLASGERPDIIMYSSDSAEAKYTKSGLLLPINNYFDKAPNLKKYGEKGIWNVMKQLDGNIYAVPNGGANGNVDNTPIFRKDWLDKLGLSVPATIDEFYQVADAFTNQDPDGNGKKDTYALGGYTNSGQWQLQPYDQIFGAFGVLPGQWIKQGEALIYGDIAPGMLDALKFMNKLYKSNFIDPEFVTDNSSRFKDKLIKGKFGTASYRMFMFDTNNTNNYYKPFHDNNPTGELVTGGVLQAAANNPAIGPRSLTARGWLKTSILKESKNIDAAVRLMDYLASDEGIRLMNYGLEGTDYTVENGIVASKISDEQKLARGINQIRLVFYPLHDHTSKVFQDIQKKAEAIAYRDPSDGIYVNNPNLINLGKYSAEQFLKMITSNDPIDGMFDDFVKEWNKRGGEEWTKQINDEYKARNTGK
ncbi:MAG: extracellular solute-binding protein family 1 [Paenibacillaceae bacterium]|jgi:ABC-type glycerol-3-phosphate transport system substrate-binding protein|nr:extracellular solute-binding protein family 1 [Paenibacillaceae bacterium]